MKDTQSSIHYNYTASKSKPAQTMTDAALSLCTATEIFWNRNALQFGSLDTSLIWRAKSRSIVEAKDT